MRKENTKKKHEINTTLVTCMGNKPPLSISFAIIKLWVSEDYILFKFLSTKAH